MPRAYPPAAPGSALGHALPSLTYSLLNQSVSIPKTSRPDTRLAVQEAEYEQLYLTKLTLPETGIGRSPYLLIFTRA